MSNLYLIIYILLWCAVFIYYQRKRKYFGAASVIILSYIIYAVTSLYLYNDFYFRDEYGELTLFPFIYLFVLLMIAIFPALKFKEERLILKRPHRQTLALFSLFYITSALAILPSTISSMSEGLMMLIMDPRAGEQLYAEMHSGYSSTSGGISNIFGIIYNIFTPIGILIFFYYLTLPKKNYYVLSIYTIAIITTLLRSLSSGSRTEVLMVAFSIIIAFMVIKPFLPRKPLKYVKIGGLIIASIVAILFLSITISRFGDNEEGAEGQFINYLGQCNINFNLYVLDANGTREGNRTCNTFKYLLGWDGIPRNIMETRYRYPNLGIDDGKFYTFVGDFVLDFGSEITFLIFLIFSLLVTRKIRAQNKVIQFHQLILAYFAMVVCMQGGMYLFYYSYERNLTILAFLFCYFAFKYDYLILGYNK